MSLLRTAAVVAVAAALPAAAWWQRSPRRLEPSGLACAPTEATLERFVASFDPWQTTEPPAALGGGELAAAWTSARELIGRLYGPFAVRVLDLGDRATAARLDRDFPCLADTLRGNCLVPAVSGASHVVCDVALFRDLADATGPFVEGLFDSFEWRAAELPYFVQLLGLPDRDEAARLVEAIRIAERAHGVPPFEQLFAERLGELAGFRGLRGVASSAFAAAWSEPKLAEHGLERDIASHRVLVWKFFVDAGATAAERQARREQLASVARDALRSFFQRDLATADDRHVVLASAIAFVLLHEHEHMLHPAVGAPADVCDDHDPARAEHIAAQRRREQYADERATDIAVLGVHLRAGALLAMSRTSRFALRPDRPSPASPHAPPAALVEAMRRAPLLAEALDRSGGALTEAMFPASHPAAILRFAHVMSSGADLMPVFPTPDVVLASRAHWLAQAVYCGVPLVGDPAFPRRFLDAVIALRDRLAAGAPTATLHAVRFPRDLAPALLGDEGQPTFATWAFVQAETIERFIVLIALLEEHDLAVPRAELPSLLDLTGCAVLEAHPGDADLAAAWGRPCVRDPSLAPRPRP